MGERDDRIVRKRSAPLEDHTSEQRPSRSELDGGLQINHSKLGELWALIRSDAEHINIELSNINIEDPHAQTEHTGEHGLITTETRFGAEAHCLKTTVLVQRIMSKRARPILAHATGPRDVARRVRAERQSMSKEIGWERGELVVGVVHGFLLHSSFFFLCRRSRRMDEEEEDAEGGARRGKVDLGRKG
jgi:hypothetical protein